MSQSDREERIRSTWQAAWDRIGPACQLGEVKSVAPELADTLEMAEGEASRHAELYIAGLGGLREFEFAMAVWERTARAAIRMASSAAPTAKPEEACA